MSRPPATDPHLRDLARLRRVRDRIDRDYAQPLDVEALARGVHMSAGHLGRRFKQASQPACPPPTSKTAMNLSIHASFLPQNDPDAALVFWRDHLGFEVRNDVGYRGLHWITVGPPGQPATSVVQQR